MDQILRLIASNCMFLFYDYGFNFIKSHYDPSYCGGAYVILTNNKLHIRIVKNRDGMFIDFQSVSNKMKEWLPFDLVGQLLTNDDKFDGELNKRNLEVLRANLLRIIDLFSNDQLQDTIHKVHSLGEKRAIKLFGERKE